MEKGLLHEEEKYDLPPGFLMEVMDLNESMMDDENGANTGILEKLNELEKQIYEPVKKIVEHYQEGVTSKEALLQVKEYYYKKKYLDRIRKQLKS
jgi:molecular chaperone HscB